MLEVRRGSKGARMRRRLSNSTPRKKAWLLISCAPPRPRRFSVLQTMLLKVSIRILHVGKTGALPSDQVLRIGAECYVIREVKSLSPVHDLAVGVVAVLGAEWGPSNQTLEHDGTKRPPIAVKGVSMAS